jgi:hypothetical protein
MKFLVAIRLQHAQWTRECNKIVCGMDFKAVANKFESRFCNIIAVSERAR